MLWMPFHMHVCIPVVQKALSVSACSIFPVLVYLQVKETRRGRVVWEIVLELQTTLCSCCYPL